MASTIKVDNLEGSTGSTVTVPTGQTFTVTDGIAIGSLPTITAVKGGTNQTTWAVGDLLYANGVNTLAKLTKPGSTQNLQMTSAGVPSWVTPSAGKTLQIVRKAATGKTSDGTNFSSYNGGTIGDIGTAHISQSFTPTTTTSIIYVMASSAGGLESNANSGAAIFSDSTCKEWMNANGYNVDASGFCIHASWVSGSTSAITIEFRTIGSYIGTNTNLGAMAGSGTATSPYGVMTITEIEP